MAIQLWAILVGVLFVGLLLVGRRNIAQGANAHVANGAVVLVIATVVGVWAFNLFVACGM